MNEIYALVANEELRMGQKGKYWQMHLKTADGIIKAIIWDINDPNKVTVPRKGKIIKIDLDHNGVRDNRAEKYGNLIMTKDCFSELEKKDIPKNILDAIFDAPKATHEQLKQAYAIIADQKIYKDKASFGFVMACLASLPKERLFTCPAAKSIHHNFSGGLIVHTAEVLTIAKGIASTFPFPNLINTDVIYAGATLHDMGKVLTYGLDDIGQPMSSIKETTIGHIYYSMQLADQIGRKQNVSKEFLEEILHVISSHHGKLEYGAITEPAMLESIIVSQADYIGSRAGIINSKVDEIIQRNAEVEDEWKSYGQRYVLGNAAKNWINEQKKNQDGK